MAMHDLYRVLKRQSDLFIRRYGMAMHLKEHNSKVSFDGGLIDGSNGLLWGSF